MPLRRVYGLIINMEIVVGVLRGGPSREYDVSLKTGAAMLTALPRANYEPRDIFISKSGVWHVFGRPVEPERILRQIDVALIGLHGEYGEDGEVQKVLERYGVPYVGSDSFSSFIAMHKVFAKKHAREAGLKTPRDVLVEKEDDVEKKVTEIIRSLTQPVVVKPVRWGSSVGVSIVSGYAPLMQAVSELFKDGAGNVLVEEYIRGAEATVGVVEGLRGEELYTPPVVEIVPPEKSDFFSYDAKYSGDSKEICPGNFSKAVSKELEDSARAMHKALMLRHYSRSDFIVSPGGVYYLETNTLPGLTPESLLPKSLNAVGVSMPIFLEHLVNLALTR
ncbi:MAG TPA: ATP-grasp domain-containing protein [Candidatus Kaiserbacteria bacterium]|nr:ATP-grasp domain-containing protein [Candidatus Kaiserbacteria bacterium]